MATATASWTATATGSDYTDLGHKLADAMTVALAGNRDASIDDVGYDRVFIAGQVIKAAAKLAMAWPERRLEAVVTATDEEATVTVRAL
jgi:hypothetical protein